MHQVIRENNLEKNSIKGSKYTLALYAWCSEI